MVFVPTDRYNVWSQVADVGEHFIMHCAFTVARTHSLFPQHFVWQVCRPICRFAEGGAIERSLVRFPSCATVQTSLHLAPLRSAGGHLSVVCRRTRCSTLLVNLLSITLIIEIDLRVLHPDVGHQCGSLAGTALTTADDAGEKSACCHRHQFKGGGVGFGEVVTPPPQTRN